MALTGKVVTWKAANNPVAYMAFYPHNRSGEIIIDRVLRPFNIGSWVGHDKKRSLYGLNQQLPRSTPRQGLIQLYPVLKPLGMRNIYSSSAIAAICGPCCNCVLEMHRLYTNLVMASIKPLVFHCVMPCLVRQNRICFCLILHWQ